MGKKGKKVSNPLSSQASNKYPKNVNLEEHDAHSSAARSFFESRLVLWSIVEAIQETVLREQEEEQQTTERTAMTVDWPADLPMSFGSTRGSDTFESDGSAMRGDSGEGEGEGEGGVRSSPKRKKKRKLSYSKLSFAEKLIRNCRKLISSTSGRIQEDNIFYVNSALWNQKDHATSSATENTEEQVNQETPHYHLVQVRGLAPPITADRQEEILLIRFLQTMHFTYIYRSQLIPITSSSHHRFTSAEEMFQINTIHQQVDEDLWFQLLVDKPAHIHDKYWDQRYRIFHKYDKGIQLDEESWYSITYECIGNYIIDQCIKIAVEHDLPPIRNVIDGFSGCGGMTIPIANRGLFVVAIDVDERKLQYLRHNAKIYNVEKKIEYVQDNIWIFLKSLANYESFQKFVLRLEKAVPKLAININVDDLFRYKPYKVSLVGDSDEQNENDDEEREKENVNRAEEKSIKEDDNFESPLKRRTRIRFADQTTENMTESIIANVVKSETTETEFKEIQEIDEYQEIGWFQEESPKQVAKDDDNSASKQHIYDLKTHPYDLVILSPPWNGPNYLDHEEYDLGPMLPCGNGYCLACLTTAVSHFFVLILPRNTSDKKLRQLASTLSYKVIIEKICLHRKPKVKVCYFFFTRKK